MKKLSLLMALVFICSSLSGAMSFADGQPRTCTITFFTNDDYLLMGRTDYEEHKSFEIEREYGHVITNIDLPSFAVLILGCDAYVEWAGDESPVGYEVTEDIAFEAYVANKPDEIADVRYFGADMTLIEISYDSFTDRTIGYPVGHVLTEDDVPEWYPPMVPGSSYPDHYIEWTVEPVGTTVYGGEEFEGTLIEILEVVFYDSHYSRWEDGWELLTYYDVEYGTSVAPPTEEEIPQYPGEVFIGWASDGYLNVVTSKNIGAEYRPLGDANIDGVVNSGDAAYILRHALGMVKSEVQNFDELADYNCDGAVNTGDAAGVLAVSVNG